MSQDKLPVRQLVLSLIAFLVVLGIYFGQKNSRESMIESFPDDTTWPQTLEGTLEISVEEGEVGLDGLSAINFGTLHGSGMYLSIEVSATALRESGFSRADTNRRSRVQATLSGPGQFSTPEYPSYRISALRR